MTEGVGGCRFTFRISKWRTDKHGRTETTKLRDAQLQTTHLTWVQQTCRKWFPNATLFAIAKGGQIQNWETGAG